MAAKKTAGKGAAAKPSRTAPAKAEKPKAAKPKELPRDPDTIVHDHMGDILAHELRRRQINLSKSECGAVSLAIVLEFIMNRAKFWGQNRVIDKLGKPTAQAVGFATPALPAIARAADELGLPLEKPIFDWEPDQVATFLALGHDAIVEQEVRALEADETATMPFGH